MMDSYNKQTATASAADHTKLEAGVPDGKRTTHTFIPKNTELQAFDPDIELTFENEKWTPCNSQ